MLVSGFGGNKTTFIDNDFKEGGCGGLIIMTNGNVANNSLVINSPTTSADRHG